MEAWELYKQIKKGVKESKKYGKVYNYIYMSEDTLKMFETSVKFTKYTPNSFSSICGLTICINNDMPEGCFWITNEPPYFPSKKKKDDSQEKQAP